MSATNGFSVGERVVVLTPGTAEESRPGIIVGAPTGRVSVEDQVWVQLSRPLLGRSLVQMPCYRVRREDEMRWCQVEGCGREASAARGLCWSHYHGERAQPDWQPDYPQKPAAPGFASLLREFRDRRRLSQSRLAEAAGFDHSYVSRLESGTRMPTREAVGKLADAMGLDDGDRDALLASAGFLPHDPNNLIASEPAIVDVLEFLRDRSVPADVRDDLRHMITLLVRQAQRNRAAVGA